MSKEHHGGVSLMLAYDNLAGYPLCFRQPSPDDARPRVHQGARRQRQRPRVRHVLRHLRLRERESRTGTAARPHQASSTG